MTIETTMSSMPQIWDKHDNRKFFTVGRGKARYSIWTCGPCGLHYCYRIDENGLLFAKRAVEPNAKIILHIQD